VFDGMYNPDQMEADFENLPKMGNKLSKVIEIKEQSDMVKYLVLFLFCFSSMQCSAC